MILIIPTMLCGFSRSWHGWQKKILPYILAWLVVGHG